MLNIILVFMTPGISYIIDGHLVVYIMSPITLPILFHLTQNHNGYDSTFNKSSNYMLIMRKTLKRLHQKGR